MTTDAIPVTPTRPYLIRAIYEWINDNQLTPYLLVNAEEAHVKVPRQYVRDGQIVLNLAPHAIHRLDMDNEALSFLGRFGGVSQSLYIPVRAVLGLYARENGQGLFFDPQEYANVAGTDPAPLAELPSETDTPAEAATPAPKKPGLRVLD